MVAEEVGGHTLRYLVMRLNRFRRHRLQPYNLTAAPQVREKFCLLSLSFLDAPRGVAAAKCVVTMIQGCGAAFTLQT